MQISQAKRVSLCSAQSEAQPQQMPEPRIEKSASIARAKKSVFSGLSLGQLMVIGLLAVANFCATVTFSSIVPFFPTEAIHRKGLTTAQVGLIIGGFQLVVFLMSPLIGKNMNLLGQYRAFSGGILLSGLATIAFGIASLLPSGTPFFVGMLLIRTFQAVGSSAFSTGSWAIVGRLFPDRINMITAINEISYGLGFTLGPPMGSALYEVGGYALPLYVVGMAQLLVVVLAMALYRSSSVMAQVPHLNSERTPADDDSTEKDRHPTVFRLLFIPDVFMTMVSLFAVCFAWSFYEPDLAQHLSTFPSNWSPPLLVGFNMTLLSCSYMLAAPIWGFLMDRCLAGRTTSVMVFGAILVLIFCLLVGPVPVLGLPKTLFCIGISFVFLGISGAVLYVPVFKWCVDAAKSRGYDEKSPALCGLISGLFQSTVSLGAFLGTFLGGLSAERIGFQWTAAWVAGLQVVQLLLQLLYALAKRLQKARNSPRIMPTLETTTIYRQKY